VPPEARGGHRSARVVAVATARRAVGSAALWGLVFGGYAAYAALQFPATYPTAASRAKVAAELGGNPGLVALFGQGQRLGTVAGFTSWRVMGVLTLLGGVWGILTATRLTRGEEDAGRWELFLAGQTTRQRAAAQAIAGLAAGLVTLWAITAVITVAAGSAPRVHFPVTSSLFLAVSVTAGAAEFLAVGTLAGQLISGRRQASAVAAAVLGACFLIRVVADAAPSLRWLRWVSPLGWAEQLRPLTSPDALALLPIAGLAVGLAAASIALAGRRDLGGATITTRDSAAAHTRLLNDPTGLAVRLSRQAMSGWCAGLAVTGLVGGLASKSAATAISGSTAIRQVIGRLGGHPGSAAYLGVIFLVAAALVCVAAAGQIAATRDEEAEGHVDHLVARPVGRLHWLAGRLLAGVSLIIAASLAAGVAGWAGEAAGQAGLSFVQLLKAGVNIAPPALFVLGMGTLAYGWWPRFATTAVYGLVAWSFMIELIAAIITNRWLADTSVLHHISPVPAADPDWDSATWLVGLAIAAAVVGGAGFKLRDLASA
jgi:ABC-2 type transport system permease protein